MTTQDAKLNHLKKAERRMSELIEELSRLNEQVSVITTEIAQTQAEIIGIVNSETNPLHIVPSKNKPKPKKEDVEKIIKNIYNKGKTLVCTKDEMKSMHLLTISHFLKSQTCVVTPLSNAVTNVLARNGVFDAYALSLCTKHQLMCLRGISKQRIIELEEFLTHIGVTLAEGDGDDDIVGFCGVVSWIDGKLTPLDHDSYYPSMKVYGYEESNNNGETILDILVLDW